MKLGAAAPSFVSSIPVNSRSRFLSPSSCHALHTSNSPPLNLRPAPSAPAATPVTMKKNKPNARVARGFGVDQIPRFKYTGKLRPGTLSETRFVPSQIARPDYWKDGLPKAKQPRFPWDIKSLDEEQIQGMRVSCRMAREILDIAGQMVKPGVLTDQIDAVVHDETVKRGAYPSPLNYNRFPKSCCTSINEVVCHGIPDSTALSDGDIINIDVTVYYNGFHGDCSETFLVGEVDDVGRKLVRVTHECLEKAIDICKPGLPVKKIGGVIEDHARRNGFSVVRNFCGHGVNSVFHTTPNVMHFRNNEAAGILKPGVTFTIEPMINEGTHRNIIWPDDWTATTLDGKRSAQFEHTLLITDNGVERLTQKLDSSPKYFWEL
ncbi:Methionyl aminopeptidase [Gracilaria domingensis]|nr:Methionyl aminopeptidase [Gracilaria domingensis]